MKQETKHKASHRKVGGFFMPKSAEKFPIPWKKFRLLGHPDTVSTQNKASITLSSFLLHRVANARIEKFMQNSALGDFVWVRLFNAATANPRDGNCYRSNRITTDLKILGKDSETLAGRDDHSVPNHSVDEPLATSTHQKTYPR